MAYVLIGAGRARWQAADWVMRAIMALVIPPLSRYEEGRAIARQVTDAVGRGERVIDLTVALTVPASASAWREAVRAGVYGTIKEPSEEWNVPSFQPMFLAALQTLEALARPSNEALIGSMAEGQRSADGIVSVGLDAYAALRNAGDFD